MRDVSARREEGGKAAASVPSDAELALQLRARFRARCASEPRVFRAPGRVNLIGEHTDYNDGLVLPMAIERCTMVAVAPRNDDRIVAVSSSETETVTIDLQHPGPARRGTWSDYLEGVVRSLLGAGRQLSGADVEVVSTLPAGGGLSSSAALEVAFAQALLAVAGASMGKAELAAACQSAEHAWVGTRCGIMDQLTVLCGEADHALFIDCRSLRTQLVPLILDEVGVLITDSTVSHRLASSGYNDRRRECEEAVRLLQGDMPAVRALRDVSLADLAAGRGTLPAPLDARARHVVGEIARVEDAVSALRGRDWERLGALMQASHASLRDDFQVSTPELDLLVDTALACSGVAGARMTGGGFGGSILTLGRRSALPAVAEQLERTLFDRFGRRPRSFSTRAARSAGEVTA